MNFTQYVKSVFASLPHGCSDVDAIVSAVLRAGVPHSLMSKVSKRVEMLKSLEACYSPLPASYKDGSPTGAPTA